MRIRDLKKPVTACKADWLPGITYLGFTPTADTIAAQARCQSTIKRQFGDGYVLEYVTRKFDDPNPGYEDSPRIVEERKEHAKRAGRIVAVHKLLLTARRLNEVVGDKEFEALQDMWAEPSRRRRWSVAFPIVESYEILGWPKARDVFGDRAYTRLFTHPSGHLRTLTESEQESLRNLEIAEKAAPNAHFVIDDEIKAAELMALPSDILKLIEDDLSVGALEGETEERKRSMKKRAAWLANKFVLSRVRAKSLYCDRCAFDPAKYIDTTMLSARSALDVHHTKPLEEGVRRTTLDDFALLCPNCHRMEHMLLRRGMSFF